MLRPRSLRRAALILALMASPAAFAASYTFDNGGFRFDVPDGWSRIMQTRGDPETVVYQVPDTSPTGKTVLARVSVTSKQVRDITDFQAFVASDAAHAQVLPDFQLDKDRSSPTTFHYTASEGGIEQTYVTHNYFHDGHAVQIRCVRPSHSEAGAEWTRHFDEGCAAITSALR